MDTIQCSHRPSTAHRACPCPAVGADVSCAGKGASGNLDAAAGPSASSEAATIAAVGRKSAIDLQQGAD